MPLAKQDSEKVWHTVTWLRYRCRETVDIKGSQFLKVKVVVWLATTGADPGGVDWVASHPPLEQPTKKKNIIRGKTNGNTWVPKNIEIPRFKSLQCYSLQFVLPKSPCFRTNVGQLKIN